MGVVGPSNRNMRRWKVINDLNATKEGLSQQSREINKSTANEKVLSKEVKDMKCKKVSIMDAIGQVVFLDNYGIANFYIDKVTINLGNDVKVSHNDLYKESSGDYFERIRISGCEFIRNESWDSNTYYIPKSRTWYNELRKGQEAKVKIKSIVVTFSIYYKTNFDQQRSDNACLMLEFKNKKEMNDYKVWVIEKFKENKLRLPDLADIKLNDLFYCVAYGIVKVIKVYEYPNRNNLICDVETLECEKITIYSSYNKLFYLPYDEPKNSLAVLDECENELALLPYVVREGQTYNVYWKAIDEAADYIVSLYRITVYEGKKDLYHLNDYIIERNENMFIISGLIGNTFVFKVSAEDRSGKKIAVSRGIVEGYPTYLVEEE